MRGSCHGSGVTYELFVKEPFTLLFLGPRGPTSYRIGLTCRLFTVPTVQTSRGGRLTPQKGEGWDHSRDVALLQPNPPETYGHVPDLKSLKVRPPSGPCGVRCDLRCFGDFDGFPV